MREERPIDDATRVPEGRHSVLFAALRGVLSGTLLAAAILKMFNHEDWGWPGGYAIKPVTPALSIAAVETLLGIWILLGRDDAIMRKASMALFAAFAVASFYLGMKGEPTCGCFGKATISPWFTFSIDSVATFGLYHLHPPGVRSIRRPLYMWCRIATCLIVMMLFTPLILPAHREALKDTYPIDPAGWINKEFPLFGRIDVGEEIAKGSWALVFYHHDCTTCQTLIPRYERKARELRERGGGPRLALVEMPPYAPPGEALPGRASPCLLGRLDGSRRWIAATPLEISLEDRVVIDRRSLLSE